MLECKNCQTEFEGNYCPNCGQRYIDKRFTLKESIAWAFHSVFNFDKGFGLTSKDLIIKPGVVIRGFLNGITIPYAHPFRFIFIWASIAAILGVWAGTYQDTSIAVNSAMGVSPEALENGKRMQEIMGQYMSFVMLLMVPFYSLGSFLFFKEKKYNYAEHLIINSYSLSSSIMIGIPLTIVYGYFPEYGFLNVANLIFGIIIISRIYGQTFEVGFAEGFAKYLLTFISAILTFSIFLIVALIGYSIIAAVFDLPNPFLPPRPAPIK